MAAVTVIHYRGKDDSRDNKLTVEVQEKKKSNDSSSNSEECSKSGSF